MSDWHSDPDLVSREYASLDRHEGRRCDRTAWLCGIEEYVTLLGAVAEARPHRVLDAGCGVGYWASLVAAPEVVGVDQSEAAVAAARARGLKAFRATLDDLPFDDESFDLVMCNWVLYHLRDLDRGLRELTRVLRPGGHFVGGYTLPDHLDELWSVVGRRPTTDPASDAFDGHNGARYLARYFQSVERRDTSGKVMWENREAMSTYFEAFGELLGELKVPAGPYPFYATRRNCVFVAKKAL
ncbi:MAG: class I SAM-dependent methyltransferase [Streptosporangiaceae bacterium]|nr:class I SAM-dependent methyltransferase [Streptosporangiaceae bacterium]